MLKFFIFLANVLPCLESANDKPTYPPGIKK